MSDVTPNPQDNQNIIFPPLDVKFPDGRDIGEFRVEQVGPHRFILNVVLFELTRTSSGFSSEAHNDALDMVAQKDPESKIITVFDASKIKKNLGMASLFLPNFEVLNSTRKMSNQPNHYALVVIFHSKSEAEDEDTEEVKLGEKVLRTMVSSVYRIIGSKNISEVNYARNWDQIEFLRNWFGSTKNLPEKLPEELPSIKPLKEEG